MRMTHQKKKKDSVRTLNPNTSHKLSPNSNHFLSYNHSHNPSQNPSHLQNSLHHQHHFNTPLPKPPSPPNPLNKTSPLKSNFSPPRTTMCTPLHPHTALSLLSYHSGCSLGLIQQQDCPKLPRIHQKTVTEPSWLQRRTEKAFQDYHSTLWSLRNLP